MMDRVDDAVAVVPHLLFLSPQLANVVLQTIAIFSFERNKADECDLA